MNSISENTKVRKVETAVGCVLMEEVYSEDLFGAAWEHLRGRKFSKMRVQKACEFTYDVPRPGSFSSGF